MTDNEKIAEFMGLPLTRKSRSFSGTGHDVSVPFMQWKYDKSWDWLMPVVEKIYRLEDGVKRLGVQVTIKNSKCTISINKKRFVCHTISPLNSTYGAVVQFLNWYNSQK